ncbi:MAG: hypothetical protein ACO1OB_27500, partial [Archangium sp.]
MKAALLALLLAAPGTVAAPDGGVSCVEVEQRLATTQRTLATCNETAKNAATARDRCQAELAETGDKLESSAASVQACVAQREQQCQEAAVMAASMLQGTARGVGSCVPQNTQEQLQTLLNGWFAVSRSLSQLDDYATGASDLLPRSGGPTDAERKLNRLLGARTGTPLWNRRLLIEAFKLTAPSTWGKLKAQGSNAIDTFFDSRGPLPESFITEANGEHPDPAGPAGPPLSAALKLTVSYLQIANCDTRADSRECGRARQLVELLDNTGPLIIRRRVDEMWSTPCNAVSADTVRAWLQDFPVSGKEKGQAALAELSGAARSKLFHCYLGVREGDASYRTWAASRLPQPGAHDARTLPLVD